MKIGIGTPGTIETLSSEFLLEWAQRADRYGFSTLTHLDRLAYSNHDPFIALAMAAAVTTRIRLQTSVLLAPARNAGIVAKQAASLDALSGGRLTLGMAVGSRADDYVLAPADIRTRGARFDQQLDTMTRLWAGEVVDGAGPLGPEPCQNGGPEILIGGRALPALRRVARWGTGYVTGAVFSADIARATYSQVQEFWSDMGRTGTPRFVGTLACAIGQDAAADTAASIDHYYQYRGVADRSSQGVSPMKSDSRRNIPSTLGAIQEILAACESIGMDEVIVRPGVAEVEQIDKLAELLR